MKRLVFKKWVMVVLGIIDLVAFMFICSDSEDLITWLIVHFVAGLVFWITSSLMIKYMRKEWL